MWGIGAIEIVRQPTDYYAYLAVCWGLAIVAYVATQRVTITEDKIEFYRFFIKYAEANRTDVRIVKRLVGQPPLLPGYAFVGRSDQRTIAELVGGNFKTADIDELERQLSTHSCR